MTGNNNGTRTRCDRTPAWAQLQAHFAANGKDFDARIAFGKDAHRFASFSQRAPHVDRKSVV